MRRGAANTRGKCTLTARAPPSSALVTSALQAKGMCNAQQRIRCRVQAQHIRLHDVPKLGKLAEAGSWLEGMHDAHGNASQANSEPAHILYIPAAH